MPRTTRGRFLALGPAVLALAAGCSVEVGLRYTPRVQGISGSGPIEIARVSDPSSGDASGKARGLGRLSFFPLLRNEYPPYPPGARIVTQDSPGDWVRHALRTELAAAGFRPRIVDSLPPGCRRGVELELRKVRLGECWRPFGGADWDNAQVALQLRLTLAGKVAREELIEGEGRGPDRPHQAAYDRHYVLQSKQQALSLALQNCMKRAVTVIAESFRDVPP
jgi:hypothetical protein